MKIKFLIAALLLTITFASSAQDAKEILNNTYNKCQSIQKGYYEMTKYMKYLSRKDTSIISVNCYFRKQYDDSLYPLVFHLKLFLKGEYTSDMLYTGEAFVRTSVRDSTAEILSKSKWAKDIKLRCQQIDFFSPLTNRKSYPIPHDSDFIDKTQIFKFIGEEYLNNISCYHIQLNKIPENNNNEMMKPMRIELHFWVSKYDFIPVQYSIAFDVVMQKDTMFQYEKYILTKYKIDTLKDENIFSLSSIPAYFRAIEYVPYKSPDPLPKDTLAPYWQLLSLTNEKLSLTDLKGKLVLIDFFYKSCYPCMQALPALQALNEKYKDKGLQIIGIDPYDKKEDDMAAFLTKRGVTYTVLLGGKDAAKDYRVSGYPTLYLIDKNGIIIFIQVGYGTGTERTLEEIILKNL